MSLINDALKRTKDAQQQNPPPAGGPALKPAEPALAKSASNAKTLLYVVVACALVGNAFLFLYFKDRGAKKEAAPAIPAAAKVSPAPAVTAPVAAIPTAPAPAPKPVAVIAVNPVPVAEAVAVETNSAVAAPVVAVQPEPPKPAPLKLQSIIYNPSRPSAMISGKFLFIGDKVQGFRVTAIDQETVTLVGNGATNVLSLP